MIKPVFTEKSLRMAKEGSYSFWVDRDMTKNFIKSEISKLFGVHVTNVRTINVKGETGRNLRGVRYAKKPVKKAIVTLKDKEKIELFEESKK